MGKYDKLKIIKKTKARIEHKCQNCRRLINIGDFYYSLELSGRVHYPRFQRKAFCENCYRRIGDNLRLL